MPVKISEEDAKKMGLSASKMRRNLIDPLLASGSSSSPKQSKSSSHKSPKVARRLTASPGPEGHGSLQKDGAGKITSIVLDLDLLPVPKERARTVRTKNNKTISFTPARTKRFTQDVKQVLDLVMQQNGPIEGPVKLEMIFRMEIPKSWPQWKQEAAQAGSLAPTARPDMDNLEKALLDALNERAFIDDAFVVERFARKQFDLKPGIHVKVISLRDRLPSTAKKSDLDTISK